MRRPRSGVKYQRQAVRLQVLQNGAARTLETRRSEKGGRQVLNAFAFSSLSPLIVTEPELLTLWRQGCRGRYHGRLDFAAARSHVFHPLDLSVEAEVELTTLSDWSLSIVSRTHEETTHRAEN